MAARCPSARHSHQQLLCLRSSPRGEAVSCINHFASMEVLVLPRILPGHDGLEMCPAELSLGMEGDKQQLHALM